MYNRPRNASLIVGGLMLLLSAAVSRAQFYTATVVGNLNAFAGAQIEGMNASGLIVGYGLTSASGYYDFNAFSATGGVVTNLGTLGGNYSEAYGVNDAGVIVGGSKTASGEMHAFSDFDGTMTDLGTLGGPISVATAINSSGLIVGYGDTATGFDFDVFTESGGVKTNLGTLGGFTAQPTAVNDSGLIVGLVGFDESFGFTYLGFSDSGGNISYFDGVPNAVNDSGLIVGRNVEQGFTYSDGVDTDIGTLGGAQSDALAVNNSGEIVGYTTKADTGYLAMSDIGGVQTDLNLVTSAKGTDLQSLGEAFGVTDDGVIGAIGVDRYLNTVLVLLTPTSVAPTKTLSDFVTVPDGSSSALLLAIGVGGFVGAGLLRRREG